VRFPLILRAALGAVVVATLVGTVSVPAHSAVLGGLEGDGSPASPYLIDSAADLSAVAEAINLDTALSGSSYRLAADIDFNGESFIGIDRFTGTFDGAGHAIRNITYGPSTGSAELGLIRMLSGGRVHDLTLDGVSAESADQRVGGIAVDARDGAVLERNTVHEVALQTGHDYAGGIAAQAQAGASIRDNRVEGTISSARYSAGITGYGRNSLAVERNLVDVEITITGNRAHAGLVVAYGGSSANPTTVTGNVAYGGGITDTGSATTASTPGRIVAVPTATYVISNNLANADILLRGEKPEAPGPQGKHGSDATLAELSTQESYTGLGWDFTTQWRWDETRLQPLPARSALAPLDGDRMDGIVGRGTAEVPFEIGNSADLTLVAATINADPTRYADDHYVLTADVDYADAAFPGITTFSGVLDGAGHTLANITYSGTTQGLVHNLVGGTIRSLTIDGLEVIENGEVPLAALAVNASAGAVVQGNSVIDVFLRSANQQVGGLVMNAQNGVLIADNYLQGYVRSPRYAAALVAYARYDVQVTRNLVDATVHTTGSRAHGSLGMAFQGAHSNAQIPPVTVSHNVVRGGEVTYSGGTLAVGLGRFVSAPSAAGTVISDNLSHQGVLLGGATADAPGADNRNGMNLTAAALGAQSTYEELRWDFTSQWRWDTSRLQPLPILSGVSPVPGDVMDGITGRGTSAEPFQIASAEDLDRVVAAVNADADRYADDHYRLTANVNYAGGAFPGFDRFTGVFDGAGHKIYNLTYGASASGQDKAFVRELIGGTIRSLTLDGLTVREASGQSVAGIASKATGGAVIQGNSILNADLQSNATYSAGIVANAEHGALIADNSVQGYIRSSRYPGGIASYARYDVQILRNLLDVTVHAQGSRAHGSMILAYQGNHSVAANKKVTISGNVLRDGALTYRGGATALSLGRIVAMPSVDGTDARIDNLSNREITLAGERAASPGADNRNGTDTDPAALSLQSTYEALGWDFSNQWIWDAAQGQPVPERHFLYGSGTSAAPFEIRTAADLEFFAASVNAGDANLASGHVWLSADLDFTGREPFVGVDRFSGAFNGRGLTISGIRYAPSATSSDVGLIRELSGTVRSLTLDAVTATGSSAASALVVSATGTPERPALIETVQINSATIEAPTAGGLAARATHARITRNDVTAEINASNTAGGLVGTAGDGVHIDNNLASATATVSTDDGGAGVVVGALTTTGSSVDENVVLAGSVARPTIDTDGAGRVGGALAAELGADNLANTGVSVNGTEVAGPGTRNRHGQDATSTRLSEKDAFVSIGWDFVDDWRWDATAKRPRIKTILPEEMPNRMTVTFYGDPQTQRAFSWYQAVETDHPAVLLSTDRSFAAGPATREVEAEARANAHGETVFQAVATDLAPGNTYYYRVGDALEGVWGATGEFRTADGDDSFTFIDLTDTQAKAVTESELSGASLRSALSAVPEAEFIVHNGDVVQDGHVEQDWIDLLGAAQDSLLRTTIAPAAGNHEDTQSSFVDHFTLEAPNNQDTTSGAYYSYTYDGAHFMVLNTNEDADQAISDAQLTWLQADARAARNAGANWLILVMHKGVYTAGSHVNDADVHAMRQKLVPVIDELEIDLVLQGHDHYLSRSKVLASDPSTPMAAKPVETTVFTESVNGTPFEYMVDPDGTLYLLPNTAGAKHYGQVAATELFDLEAYLSLFDRLGTPLAGTVETFLAVDVTAQRLSVSTYHLDNGTGPVFIEGVGIDRTVSAVADRLAALPIAADVTEADRSAVTALRGDVDALTAGQRSALELEPLTAAERRLRELAGLLSTTGEQVAWADADATTRQQFTVRNDTARTFTDVPVQLKIAATPDVARNELAFTDATGAPLSYEVESWLPGGASVVWVKLPELKKHSVDVVWAYYGAQNVPNDPSSVWSADYALVDHLEGGAVPGVDRIDATGKHRGVLVGKPLAAARQDDGSMAMRFEDSRLEYPGTVGGGYRMLSVSTVVTLTEADLAATGESGTFLAKSRAGDSEAAFTQSVAPAGAVTITRGGRSFSASVPADGKPHLVTQVNDGMTFAVFVDGVEQHSSMYGRDQQIRDLDNTLPVTIGGMYAASEARSNSFVGTIGEVQIAGVAFVPEFEAFRYANYFGDAVTAGQQLTRADEGIDLVVGTPAAGSTWESGLVEVTGSVSHRAALVVTTDGEEVFRAPVDAGRFSLPVPLHLLGARDVVFTAESVSDDSRTTNVTVPLTIVDTIAPAEPEVSHRAAAHNSAVPGRVLSVTSGGTGQDSVTAELFVAETAELSPANLTVRSGYSADRVPTALTPTSGEVTDDLTPETIAADENPFQIYEIALTPEQIAQDRFQFAWNGTGGDRRVSAWVWDHLAGSWLLKDQAADAAGGVLSLDVTATTGENVVGPSGAMTVLIWRGLVSDPTADDTVYERYPDGADFDWAFNHVPDTQLYSEATPWMMTDMFEHIVAGSADRKTELVVHAGDWINNEALENEYQWLGAEPSARLLEAASIPLMASWGNHDYSLDRNGRVMLQKYFPMSRLQAGVEGSAFTFGGSQGIDNYYYETELGGAKLLFLALSYWSTEFGTEDGLAWAREVIESHPDHTIVLATHHHLQAADTSNIYSNPVINQQLIDPYDNVVLTLSGHQSGSYVTSRTTSHGTQSFGILTDYQTRAWGGHEFYKNISVDAENGLLYVNTYSPWLDRWTSDGRWHSAISESTTPGFHGDDSENFVLELDFGGAQERRLATDQVVLTVGEPVLVGAAPLTGTETFEVSLSTEAPNPRLRARAAAFVLTEGIEYAWQAVLTDAAGFATSSAVQTFVPEIAEKPTEPGKPTESGGPNAGGDDHGKKAGAKNGSSAADADRRGPLGGKGRGIETGGAASGDAEAGDSESAAGSPTEIPDKGAPDDSSPTDAASAGTGSVDSAVHPAVIALLILAVLGVAGGVTLIVRRRGARNMV
jgi:hypothetical protein